MGFTYLQSLTGSVSNRPAIQMVVDATGGNKYFDLQVNSGITKSSVFYVKDNGDLGGTGLTFESSVYSNQYKLLHVSSSLPYNSFSAASKGYNIAGSPASQAGIRFWNINGTRGPATYPNADGWVLFSGTSGSLVFSAGKQSYQFSSSNVVSQGGNTVFAMIQVRNGFYFWPYMAASSTSRDGAIGIGVQPPTEPTGSFSKYLRAKLHINMFSGSGEGPWTPEATTEHRHCAIMVQYGSGSLFTPVNTTFYVSSSGIIYSRALTSNGAVYSNNGRLTNVNPSDEFLKENITPLTYGLNEIVQLNPVKYNFIKSDPNNVYFDDSTKIGLLAQEVESVVPEIVKSDHGVKGMDTLSLIPVLINSIKELKNEIDALKNQST